DGRFRQDLYYRLKVIEIRVPPLRDRPDDIPMLVERFLRRAERTLTIDEDALTLLRSWPWPGNVRELENVIAQAVALSPGPTITDADLPRDLRGEQAPASSPGGVWTLAEVERDYTRRILDRCGGNKSQAARLLGVDRKTLQRILAR
ncbi:MAG: sigma-54-dependent Fis family transcriptional regulator, partial [Myxococcales bacterium]|nr:sigma-54-dependent Fis family transcriptional regulator [Myxococcales bacterium]